jgi:hypothetical protein
LRLSSPIIVVEEFSLESISKNLYVYSLLSTAFSQAKESPQSRLHISVPQAVNKRIRIGVTIVYITDTTIPVSAE